VASEEYVFVESIMDTYFNNPLQLNSCLWTLLSKGQMPILFICLNFCVPCSGSAREAWWPQMGPNHVGLNKVHRPNPMCGDFSRLPGMECCCKGIDPRRRV